jgi:hypothetical protein
MEIMKRLDRHLINVLTPHPRHPARTVLAYVSGLLWAGVMGNFLFSLFGWLGAKWANNPQAAAPPWAALWFCLGAVALLVLWSSIAKTPAPASNTTPLVEAPPPPMKGLILLLSYYRTHGGLAFDEFSRLLDKPGKSLEEWRELERAAESSNFDVPLQAIRYHMKEGQLRDVWLICTEDAKDEGGKVIADGKGLPLSPGSWRLAPYLEKYVREAPHAELAGGGGFDHAGRVKFHYHSEPSPKPKCLVNVFGEQGSRDVFKAVNYVFDMEVELEGLEMEDVICDITGARAPHTVGMVISCLPARRRIQYSSSVQTPDGRYTGRAVPKEIRCDSAWISWWLLRLIGGTGESSRD